MTIGPSADGAVDLELHYREGMSPVRRPSNLPREYLWSGDGTIVGPGLRGSVRWDLNEHVGREACQMFFAGVVETDDGASISFDTLGFGQVTDPATAPSRWAVTATARFVTDDPRYAWLSVRPVRWLREFNMDTYEHRYRIIRA